MKLPKAKRVGAIIPTASMADIAFLLIIFFMVTTVQDVDRTSVNLPGSHVRSDTEKGAALVVLHDDPDEGLVYKFSNGEDMSHAVGGPRDIYLEASRIAMSDPSRQFILKADQGARYALVDEILDQLRKAGVTNVLLLTRPASERGA